MSNVDIINTTHPKKDIKKKKKKKRPRCSMENCKKKLELTTWDCKCGNRYCSKHRSMSAHKCSFNWKQANQFHLNNTMSKGKSIDTKNFVKI